MKRFKFLCKPEVIYGVDSVLSIPDIIKKIKCRKILIVVDKFFSKTDKFAKIKSIIGKVVDFVVFDKIEGEPTTEIGDECGYFGKENGCDCVIGIGGGSTLDTAKGASIIITNGGRIRDYQGIDKVPSPGVPKIMVPTTAGTGSEVTFTAVFIRKDEKKKGGINSVYLYPEFAILDPSLTLTLPPDITASTGLDALCHGMESFLSRKANFLTEIISLNAVKIIWKNLPVAYSNGNDLKARENMLYGSFLAGIGLANAGVTAVHSISYPLGGKFGVPHGIGNGLLLPYVLEFNLPEIKEKLGFLAKELNEEWKDLSFEEASVKMVEEIKNFLEVFKIPRLRDFGIPSESFSELAEDALKVSVPIENNPRSISKQDIVEIYRKAY